MSIDDNTGVVVMSYNTNNGSYGNQIRYRSSNYSTLSVNIGNSNSSYPCMVYAYMDEFYILQIAYDNISYKNKFLLRIVNNNRVLRETAFIKEGNDSDYNEIPFIVSGNYLYFSESVYIALGTPRRYDLIVYDLTLKTYKVLRSSSTHFKFYKKYNRVFTRYNAVSGSNDLYESELSGETIGVRKSCGVKDTLFTSSSGIYPSLLSNVSAFTETYLSGNYYYRTKLVYYRGGYHPEKEFNFNDANRLTGSIVKSDEAILLFSGRAVDQSYYAYEYWRVVPSAGTNYIISVPSPPQNGYAWFIKN